MNRVLVIILIIAGIGLLTVVGVGLAGYWWFQANKDQLQADGLATRADATSFAMQHHKPDCVTRALQRSDACDAVMCHALAKIWLKECLRASRPAPGFCQNIPPRSELMASAQWALRRCTELQHAGDQHCGQLLGGVQEHCAAQEPAQSRSQ